MDVPKISALKTARGLTNVFRPVELANIDDGYHAFIVRYSGDYITSYDYVRKPRSLRE